VVPYSELVSSGALRVEGEQVGYQQLPVQYIQAQQGFQSVVVEQAVVQQAVVQQAVVEVADEQAVQGGPIQGLLNQAFCFIKPHAVTEITINTVRDTLLNYGINVTAEGALTSDVIDQSKLIDQHYYAIASKATILKPDQLPVDDAKFQKAFGVPWEAALPTAFNAMDAMEVLESNVDEISQLWGAAKDNGKLVKLGGGFYCGLLEKPGYQPIYVFNAFFMKMREEYVAPGNQIYWFAVEWDETALSWADFRGQVLGPTDPATAPPDSIRGMILANWQELGLASEPNTGLNGVHASASPLEAMYERMNWLGVPCAEDTFGNYLLQCQVAPEFIDHCAVDPQVNMPDGSTGSVWDYLEDADASTCVDKFLPLVNINMSA
jgi:nucleoside diphosphate kinase